MQKNIEKLAEMISGKLGINLTPNNVHGSDCGREYYIPAPKDGAPLLLHHYRGPFFVDMSAADYEALQDGSVSAEAYLANSNWQVGYYWGGCRMIGGGYFQPMKLDNPEVPAYLRCLQCRGIMIASGAKSSEETCRSCPACESCPVRAGRFTWSHPVDETGTAIKEEDPRISLFRNIAEMLGERFPGIKIQGFSSSSMAEGGIIILEPNMRFNREDPPMSFRLVVSPTLIRDLLMRAVKPEEVEIDVMQVLIKGDYITEESRFEMTVANVESLKAAAERVDHSKPEVSQPEQSEQISFWQRLKNIFAK